MIKCPRCELMVDETVRTTCPLCYTPILPQAAAPTEETLATPAVPPMPPLNAAPSVPPLPTQAVPGLARGPLASGAPVNPAAPPSSGIPGIYNQPAPPAGGVPPPMPTGIRPGVRVSLTGEVIDSGMPEAAPPPNYVGGGSPIPPTMPRPGAPPRPGGPVHPAARRMAMETPAQSSGNGAVMAIVVILVLALVGVGGWWLLTHRSSNSNPKTVAQRFMNAFKSMDWKTMYELADDSSTDKAKYPNAQAFADDMNNKINQPGVGAFVKVIMDGIKEIKVGEATITGDTATVPVTVTVSMMGQEQTQTSSMTLKKTSGGWKVSSGGMNGVGGGGGMGGGMGGGAGGGGIPTRPGR